MHFNFQQEILDLKDLNRDELYRKFHEIQIDVLRPQWLVRFKKLMGDNATALELFGPRTPEVSEHYTTQISEQISGAEEKDILLLNHVIGHLKDPMQLLQLSRDLGFKTLILHELPNDGTFEYEFSPAGIHFEKYNFLNNNSDKQPLQNIIQTAESAGWNLISDTRLDLVYETKLQKMALVKMELGLDLIEHYFVGSSSKFEDLSRGLERWYLHPASKLVVRGCSRWLVFQ